MHKYCKQTVVSFAALAMRYISPKTDKTENPVYFRQ